MTIDKGDGATPLAVSGNNPLEQFILLAKGTKGNACAELIKQVLEAPGVHVFGELLDMPNLKEVCVPTLLCHPFTNVIVPAKIYLQK